MSTLGVARAFVCLIGASSVGCVIPLGDAPADSGVSADGPSTDATSVDGADSTRVDATADSPVDGAAPPSVDGSVDGSMDAPVDGPVDSGPSGPPPGNWVNVTSNLANMPTQCGSLTGVFPKPDEDLIFAGIAGMGLWATRDDGMTWQMVGTSEAGSASIINRPLALVFDPTTSTRFWESGIYNGPGVFETTNDGVTFEALGGATAYDCDLVSIDFTDPNRQTMLAGGHESSGTLFLSTNGGSSWTNVDDVLPPNTNCTTPLVINSTTYLVGCAGYGGGVTGIYRTTDSAATWTMASAYGGLGPPTLMSDGSIYWATPNPTQGVTRSTDQGVTWSTPVGAGVIGTSSVIELPNGLIAALGGRYVVVSADHGETWAPATAAMPIAASTLAYSTQRKAFFISYETCGFDGGLLVAPDAVQRFDSDY
jgi:photosystem II stability/assembly factor-like uncharacterized protein